MDNKSYIGLSLANCSSCHGSGARGLHANALKTPCDCVLRAVSRVVVRKYHACASDSARRSLAGFGAHRCIDAEFRADVWLLAKRTLKPLELSVFTRYHLWQQSQALCFKQLRLPRGTFFHALYRSEEQLGRAIIELRPYSLWPLDEYFARVTRQADIRPFPGTEVRPAKPAPLRPPLAPRPLRIVPVLAPEPVPVVFIPTPTTEAVAEPGELVNVPVFIRERFRAGLGFASISRDLNRRGVPSPNGAKWIPSHVKETLRASPKPRTLPKAA